MKNLWASNQPSHATTVSEEEKVPVVVPAAAPVFPAAPATATATTTADATATTTATTTADATADATDADFTDAAATIKFQIRATVTATGIKPALLL
ncbi:uncharacterized protein EV154DRAFT_571358 [Mucor mucedo]|uniref:uncharacterized protein n=1 Tax=Mucor mucedo TaxID=29922 RepID=UPI00221E79E6|nr:uncharacterized protein EV154DRAFT_571358 [Mucor mucedo]KAI7868399.1 hypothetical protein EV154DRAFT_571358 [Mucor mucedo]